MFAAVPLRVEVLAYSGDNQFICALRELFTASLRNQEQLDAEVSELFAVHKKVPLSSMLPEQRVP